MILVFRFLGPYTYFGVSLGGGFDSYQGPQQQQQQPQQQLQGGDQDSNTGTDTTTGGTIYSAKSISR